MSRFILGDCVRVMATFPGNAVDFILTDPPYLVGFRDRSGRTIAGDKTDEWLQPACNEMYRVSGILKSRTSVCTARSGPVSRKLPGCSRCWSGRPDSGISSKRWHWC